MISALKTWEDGRDFKAEIKADPEVVEHLSAKQLDALFDERYHLAHVDTIFKRVFGE